MQTRLLAGLLFASLCSLGAACGSTVVEPPGAGGSGGGTTAASTGSTASTTSSSSMGEGGSLAPCGGLAGAPCAADEYCFFSNGLCGGDDSQGVCMPHPNGCTDDCPGVCGCDGQPYCNDCDAHQAGVDVGANISCTSAGGDYSAYFFAGGLDHIMVRKADPGANVCVIVFADWPIQSSPGYDFILPDGWGVSHAIITDQAADCALEPGQMMGAVADAAGGAGKLSWVVAPGMYAPCTIDVDATITFANAPVWVPATAVLTATAVNVEGGCM